MENNVIKPANGGTSEQALRTGSRKVRLSLISLRAHIGSPRERGNKAEQQILEFYGA